MGKKSRDKRLRRMERQEAQVILRGPRAIARFGFKITRDPVDDGPGMGTELKVLAERAYRLTHDDPEQAIPLLEGLVKDHPGEPKFLNWLSIAYFKVGRDQEAQRATLRNYLENPDYLFARLNYAEMCLALGEIDEAGVALQGHTDLKQVFPDRTLFHISEFVSFTYVVGTYAFRTGDNDMAISCLSDLKAVAPESDPFRTLAAEVFGSVLTEMMRQNREGGDLQAVTRRGLGYIKRAEL